MFKTGVLLCTISLAATTSLHAGQMIEVEKLNRVQLDEAIKNASDDTAIEFQGQSKTKAEWRAVFGAQYVPQNIGKRKEFMAERKAKLEAPVKALQDEQDKSIANQNAQITKEFDEISSQK
jgi:hypothetical protein